MRKPSFGQSNAVQIVGTINSESDQRDTETGFTFLEEKRKKERKKKGGEKKRGVGRGQNEQI